MHGNQVHKNSGGVGNKFLQTQPSSTSCRQSGIPRWTK